MHAIAYNLIRALMQQAAALYHVPIERLSFKGSVAICMQTLVPDPEYVEPASERPASVCGSVSVISVAQEKR
jgi:hypothetical protein